MADRTRLHLEVTVELGDDAINGVVHAGAGPGIAFTGWLEFMSAFDTLTARAGRRPDGPGSLQVGNEPSADA